MSNVAQRDALGRRGRLHPVSTGKRVRLQKRDLLWLQRLHQHGPLASSFLLAFGAGLGSSEKRARERLTDLFHEDNAAHGGPYLTQPKQQAQTIDSRYNQIVYDIAPAGVRALKEAGQWSQHCQTGSGPWLHRFMVSSITASIRLATEQRSDLSFIPQADILNRANTELACPVSIINPSTQKKLTKTLKPDALFGLEYQTNKGKRYRFFVLEADRATEPLTTRNFNRKSALMNLLQYRAYIADGLYKTHLKLTAPLLVLNVMSNAARTDKTVELVAKHSLRGNPYILFQTWGAFAPPFKPPKPNRALLEGKWQRAYPSALFINNVG